MPLSSFQKMLLDEMRTGVWYDLHLNQGTGGEPLPDWFYRNQSNPSATIRAMIRDGALRYRRVTELKLIQVARAMKGGASHGLGQLRHRR